MKRSPLRETPVVTIQEKVLSFYDKMNKIDKFLEENGASDDIRISAKDVPLEFYIDKLAVARLMRIAMQEEFEQFGVFFGIETPNDLPFPLPGSPDSYGKLTGCFLGLNAKREILDCHFEKINPKDFNSGGIPGEETWPPPGGGSGVKGGKHPPLKNYFSLASNRTTVEKYFESPTSKPKQGR